MENEQERGLVLYIEQSLAKLDQSPNPRIQAVVRLNSEVYSHFGIGEFLKRLNEELFEGKGEVEPLSHTYSISPSVQEDEQSRFARLFSARVTLDYVNSDVRLRVKKDTLKIEKDKSPFDELVISIFQSMDIKRGAYTFYTSGSLVWKSPKRDSSGNWDSKPVRLTEVSEGRLISFYLRSVPPTEEISQALLQQINEILAELAIKGLIPELNQSSAEEPIEQ